MLQIEQLDLQRGEQQILRQLTAELHAGQTVALLGKNGAGKTTLLHTLLGLTPLSGGSIRLWQTPVSQIGPDIRQKIGFVPQQDDLLPHATAAQQLELFRRFQPRWQPALADRLVRDWEIPLQTPQHKLSLGQKQKLSIILALCHQPELLILDEPAASLDPIARRQLLTELINIAEAQQTAILFSSHLVADLERVASHVWLLQDGQLRINMELDQLKENICRLELKPEQQFPVCAGITMLRQQRDALSHTATVQQTQPGALAQLIAQAQPLHCQYLSLEEIFLELHA